MAVFPTQVFAEKNILDSLLEKKGPIRAKASPRSTPHHSARSTPSSYSEEVEKETTSNGQETPFRGRSFSLLPAEINASPFATCRHWAGSRSIDYEHDRFQNPLMSKDLSDSPEDLESSILEPCPAVDINLNVAEVLSSTSTLQDSDWTGFIGHRDTFAMRDTRHQKPLAKDMPEVFFHRLKTFIDYDTYLSIRLCCRSWSTLITSVHSPPSPSAASLLPVEILQQIYAYLSPTDFNAARHTCRTWMLSSLDFRLLAKMLKIGGFWDPSQVDVALNEKCSTKAKIMSKEWILSKRLGTECSLRPDWTGNGLTDDIQSSYPLRPSYSSSNGRPAFECFTLVSEIVFSALGSLEGDAKEAPQQLHFSTSICGKYLLVTRDCTIYIYFLKNQAFIMHRPDFPSPIDLVSTVICPHRVLAVAMDSSFSRFAVAALLVGRIGLVCDLENLGTGSPWPKHDGYTWDPVASALWEYQAFLSNAGGTQHHPSDSPPHQDPATNSSSNYSTHPHSPSDSSARGKKANTETGPYSLYYNLGSTDDPPLSVSICAQRRCVAFGCSTAIELHWVDALSGQGLNRWFPTSEVAEVLYFFSERANERRVKVICSSFIPTSWAPIENGEHYNAVPLSDGLHALFVDAFTGELCLGAENRSRSSMEIGAPYMRLETRFVFERPTGEMKDLPRFYDAGRDLRWGARVVAAFGDQVWLFVVPGDWVEREKKDGEEEWGEVEVRRISGIMVGEMEGLVGVGVNADRGGVLVRGIGAMGLVREWKMGLNGQVRWWAVMSGGEVTEKIERIEGKIPHDEGYQEGDQPVLYDADGDVIMTDAGYNPGCSGNGVGKDKNKEIRLDSDGDVIMSDAGFFFGTEFDGMWPPPIADFNNEEELDEGYYSDDGLVPWGGTVAIHPAGVGLDGNTGARENQHAGDIREAGSVWESTRCEVNVLGVKG